MTFLTIPSLLRGRITQKNALVHNFGTTGRISLHLFGSRQSQMLQNNPKAGRQLNKLKAESMQGSLRVFSCFHLDPVNPVLNPTVRPQGTLNSVSRSPGEGTLHFFLRGNNLFVTKHHVGAQFHAVHYGFRWNPRYPPISL